MSIDFLASEVSIEEEGPAVRSIPTLPTAVVGAVGTSQRGPVGKRKLANSPDEWERNFGGHVSTSESSLFVKMFFENGGKELHFVRTVHYTDASDATTKTSTTATLDLQTANNAASPGSVTSGNTGPWNLEPGDTIVASVNGGGNATATFNATAAVRESTNSETFNITNNTTITVKIDRGSVQTLTLVNANFATPSAATAEEVAAALNSQLTGAQVYASSTGAKVSIRSDHRGTGSYVEVTGGSANGVIGFATAEVQGTGNVADIEAVTFAEAKTILEAAIANTLATNVGGALKLASTTVGGGSSILIVASSTADDEFAFDNATHTGSASGALDTLQVDAKSDGTYGNNIRVIIEAPTSGEAARFRLKVEYNGTVLERWDNLSMNALDPRYVETVINDDGTGSVYIKVTDLEAAVDSPVDRPVNGTFGPLTGGGDGLASLDDADYIGAAGLNGDTGLRALDEVTNLTLLTVPGRATAAVHNAMITYCEIVREGFCFAVLDPPKNQTAEGIVTYVKDTASILRLSEYAAIYWPNLLISNPSKAIFGNTNTIVAPPSGAICGLYTRVDQSKPSGVFEHPAGIELGRLFSVAGLEMPEVKKKAKRKIVFPSLINPISQEDGTPIFVDGARTLKDTGAWPTIGERRGIIFLEMSLKIGLTFMRHRRITNRLYNEGQKTVMAFMNQQTGNGAFASDKVSEAYTIDFGPGLNTASRRHARQVWARLSVATAKPAEFVVLKVTPDQRALEAEFAAAA